MTDTRGGSEGTGAFLDGLFRVARFNIRLMKKTIKPASINN